MRILTEQEYNSLGSFKRSDNQALENGEIGYYPEKNTLVVCCRNCGDYSYLDMKDLRDKDTQ